jgi:putative endonuclease
MVSEQTQNYYVYLVRCADGSLYTGYTTDIARRLRAHNDGKGAKYTKTRRPVELVYYETHLTLSDALKREYEIKRLRRSAKMALLGPALQVFAGNGDEGSE